MEKERIPIWDGWRFCLTDEPSAVERDFDDSGWRQVDLPHDWQIEASRSQDAPAMQGFYPRDAVGVYRYRFFAPAQWRGKTVRALFDGAQRFAEVYLNGVEVGRRPYGYVPVLCDLTKALEPGRENVLAVRLDNTDRGGWIGAGGDRWYSGAGLYRGVWLLVQSETRIAHDGLRVTSAPVMRGPRGDVPDVEGIRCGFASVRAAAQTEGDVSGCVLGLEIFDPDGARIYAQEKPAEAVTAFELRLDAPLLWSTEKPALYRAEFTLTRDGQVLDSHFTRFGIRSAVFDQEDGFVLNGKKAKLWGVNLHHDGGVFGAAVPIEVWERRLRALKELGVNTVRTAHNPQTSEFYDLCDELGLMVIDELYDKWDRSGMYFDQVFPAWHLQDLETMVRRDANHPCVILWSVGNEVRGQYTPRFYRHLKELTDACRQLDPTRAVTCVLIGFCLPNANDTMPLGALLEMARQYAACVDVFAGNYMEQYYERLRESGMRKPILGAEVRTYYRGDSRFHNQVNVRLESPYATVKAHDWVCGACVWAGVDYLGESPFWPLRGWTGDLLDSTGDPKLRAFYCAAQWKNEPFLKLAVYDETEPWDGARGMWGFPQMRRHWNYREFEKVLHVAVFTNCDTVKLYQNAQEARVGYLSDFEDGMVHFWLPFIPGKLRAEGYRGGLLVAEDTIFSDHGPDSLRIAPDKTALPADGRSTAFVDVYLEDAHGERYALEDRRVSWEVSGGVRVLADNGDPWHGFPEGNEAVTHNGHLMLAVRAGKTPGRAEVTVRAEGFEPQTAAFELTKAASTGWEGGPHDGR